jgi:tetratricopeptide (TPR) repeat protein
VTGVQTCALPILMLEHVHPNLDGYFLIAKEYVHVMQEHNCISPKEQWQTPLPDDEYKSLSRMTLFDFEVSFLRIDNLLHHWPFNEPESTRYNPTSDEGQLAVKYFQGKIDWEHAHYELADFYKSQQRFTDAAREYLAIAKVLRFDFNPLVLAGDANLTMKNYHEAESIYRLALKRANNQFVNVRLGALFAEVGISDSAINYYRTALEGDIHAASKLKQEWKLELMQHLAEEYIKKGDVLHAREEALNILSVHPLDAKAKRLLDQLSAAVDSAHPK